MQAMNMLSTPDKLPYSPSIPSQLSPSPPPRPKQNKNKNVSPRAMLKEELAGANARN